MRKLTGFPMKMEKLKSNGIFKKIIEMKNPFLKFGLFLALGFTTVVFYSCEKEGNDGDASIITATNVINNSDWIATVKVKAYWEMESDWDSYTIAETQYQNNGFILELPATVPAEYLWHIISLEGSEGDLSRIHISDKTAKCFSFSDFSAYNKDGKYIGYLMHLNDNLYENENNACIVRWMYVDKNVTINGQSKYVDEYLNEEYITNYSNVTLKKGWNMAYLVWGFNYNKSTNKRTYTNTMSSKAPSKVALGWRFF